MAGFFSTWKQNRQKTNVKLQELKDLFQTVGINFSFLHPSIYRVVLKEAILKDDSNAAFARFLTISEELAASNLPEQSIMKVMVKAYEEIDKQMPKSFPE